MSPRPPEKKWQNRKHEPITQGALDAAMQAIGAAIKDYSGTGEVPADHAAQKEDILNRLAYSLVNKPLPGSENDPVPPKLYAHKPPETVAKLGERIDRIASRFSDDYIKGMCNAAKNAAIEAAQTAMANATPPGKAR